jgi:hypothetical protein
MESPSKLKDGLPESWPDAIWKRTGMLVKAMEKT